MEYKLFFTGNAEKNYDQIIQYIAVELGNITAARNFANEVASAFNRVRIDPFQFPVFEHPFLNEKGYRKILLHTMKYVIIISVIDENVYIVGIFSDLQNYEYKLHDQKTSCVLSETYAPSAREHVEDIACEVWKQIRDYLLKKSLGFWSKHSNCSVQIGKIQSNTSDFVIDVLINNENEYDVGLMLEEYKKHGVREYWVVDYSRGAVVIYDFEHDRFKLYGMKDQVPVAIFDEDLKIDFRKISDRLGIYEE